MSAMPYRVRGVRWNGMDFEMRCDACASNSSTTIYWPLTLEFWNPTHGLRRCRACLMVDDRKRHRELRARLSPETRRARDRARYLANRPLFLLKQRVRDTARRAA